jgi:hypothetical protein
MKTSRDKCNPKTNNKKLHPYMDRRLLIKAFVFAERARGDGTT